MSKSKIEWTEKTWNPVTGCTKVSQGCKNCYAERMYERFHGHGSFKNVICHDNRLLQPLSWKKPSLVFVNSMSDLFHEDVPFEFIDKVFAIMALCPQHTFQILTKRPERMVEYFRTRTDSEFFEEESELIACKNPDLFYVIQKYPKQKISFPSNNLLPHLQEAGWYSGVIYVDAGDGEAEKELEFIYEGEFPLPNVWLGISCEDQKTADERIPYLLKVPAAVRFLSCEPLLGEIDFYKTSYNAFLQDHTHPWRGEPILFGIDWLICGGESGPGARPMHPDWAISLRDQCIEAGVPFFFKQFGEWAPVDAVDPSGDIIYYDMSGDHLRERKNPIKHLCVNHSGQTSEKADDVIDSDEENCVVYKFGKHKAGNVLDGKQYLEYPKN